MQGEPVEDPEWKLEDRRTVDVFIEALLARNRIAVFRQYLS